MRIVPGLAGATLFTVFVIGVLFTSLPVREYLISPETIEYLNNFLIYDMSATLPGVFLNNPISSTVNGSLWTLPYEFTAYVIVAALGAMAFFRSAKILALVLICFLIGAYLNFAFEFSAILPIINLRVEPLFMLVGFFLSGVIIYFYRDKLIYSSLLGVLLIVIFSIFSSSPLGYLLGIAAIPYATILISYSKRLRFENFGRHGDFSYGLYIYAFPIQQSVVHLYPKSDPLDIFMVAFPATLLISIASWKFIEEPSLRLKRVFNKGRYPTGYANKKPFMGYSIRSI